MKRSFTCLAALCIAVQLGSDVSNSAAAADSATVTQLGRLNDKRDLNLGLATTEGLLVEGNTAVFTVSERAQRRDLNRDGDLDDNIMHVFNALTGNVRNLELTRSPVSLSVVLRDRLLAIWAAEGLVDLNGDGDTRDAVLHVYDTLLGTLKNLRLAGDPQSSLFFVEGRRMAFVAHEAAQGQDLNQDGDTEDDIVHVFDILTGRVQSTGLSVPIPSPITASFDGRWLALGVFEGGSFDDNGTITGGVDLDGNGSNFDTVAHVFDTVTGRTRNLRVALGAVRPFEPFGFEAGFVVGPTEGLLALPESGVDLNGDGDMDDAVLHRVDLVSGRVTNTRIAMESGTAGDPFPTFGPSPLPFAFQEGVAVFNVKESDQGQDLNGDGDQGDVVLQALSTRTWQMRSLKVSGSLFVSDLPGRAVVFMSEVFNGKDLNGDGDISDSEFIVGLADLSGREPRVVSTGLAVTMFPTNGDDLNFSLADAFAFQIRGNRVSFLVPEVSQGTRDLNGDGDTLDTVLHIADLSTLTTLNTGLSGAFAYRAVQAPLFPASAGRVVVPLSETRQGNRDLNGDGDTQDIVLQSLDVRTGATSNSGVTVAADSFRGLTKFGVPLAIRGETFVSLLVDEGSVDLNSDGDTADRVLQFFDVATGTITNLGLAGGSSQPSRSAFDDDLNFAAISNRSGFPAVPDALSGFLDPSFTTEVGPGLGDAFAFVVSEADQGNVDLNGDGDTDDRVVFATRLTDRDRNGRLDFAEAK